MKALILGLMLSACVHHVGDVCLDGDAFCTTPVASLACRGGKLVLFDCGGLKGCTEDTQRNVLCDQSDKAMPGTSCFTDYEGKGQCAGTLLLKCSGGSWVQVLCPQGTTCVKDGTTMVCK